MQMDYSGNTCNEMRAACTLLLPEISCVPPPPSSPNREGSSLIRTFLTARLTLTLSTAGDTASATTCAQGTHHLYTTQQDIPSTYDIPPLRNELTGSACLRVALPGLLPIARIVLLKRRFAYSANRECLF